MSTLTTRAGKGSPLTNTEMDDNLTNLNSDKVETSVLQDWKEPTGWIDNTNISISHDSGSRTVTLTGNLSYLYQGSQKILGDGATWVSPAHSAGNGTYFLYSTDGTNFTWSTSVWDVTTDVLITVVFHTAGYTFALREVHGLMQGVVHQELHTLLGTYRGSGLGPTSATYALDSATDADTTPGFDSGTIRDEDITSTIAATTQSTYTLMKIGAGTTPVFYTAQSFPFRSAGSFIYYNNIVSGADVVASNNMFLNVYELLIPTTADATSQTYRRVLIQPQAQYGSLDEALAENISTISLGDFPSPELVFYTRITYETNNGNGNTGKVSIASIDFITGSKVLQSSISTAPAPTAENVPFTPAGTVSSTDVQAAIEEVASESLTASDVTFESLDANADVGTAADQVAAGDHGHDTLTMDSLSFDTTAGVTAGEGEFAWNDAKKTMDLGQQGTTLQLGLESHYHVRNDTGVTITNGTVVMATGAVGASDLITVAPMDGTDSANARLILGIATQDILDGQNGKVTNFGKIHDLNTIAYVTGDVLWVSDSTPGALTNVEPAADSLGMPIAFVVYAHASTGIIAARVTPIDEHDHEPYGAVSDHESTYNHGNFADTTDITYETLNSAGDVGTGATQVAKGDHVHDDRYYTEGEIDSALSPKIEASDVTYENLFANSDVGTGADQVSKGDHNHTGVYEPADATILKDSDIGGTVQGYDANNALTTDVTFETLDANADVGTGADQVAAGDHSHPTYYDTFAELVSSTLTIAPRHVWMVYGDSTDGGTTPDTATQASIDALEAAGVPSDNIRWLYIVLGAFTINTMNIASTMESVAISLATAQFTADDMSIAVTSDAVAITLQGGSSTFVADDMDSSVTSDGVTIILTAAQFTADDMNSSVTSDGVTITEDAGSTDVTITGASTDTRLSHETGTWSAVRGASVASTVNSTDTTSGVSAYYEFSKENVYGIDRFFMYFDLSGITGTINTATLTIQVDSKLDNNTLVVVPSTASAEPAVAADYNNLTFTNYGTVSVTSTGQKVITFNASGLSYLEGNFGSTAKLALIEQHDLNNSAPGADLFYASIIRSGNHGTASTRPKLDINYT